MKVLQVVDFFKPSWEAGGIVRVCYEISKRLADNGHEITVYTTDGFKSRLDVKKNRPIDVDGMEVYYFRNVSIFWAKRNFYSPYLLPRIVKDDIRKFDIVHIHTFRSLLAIPIWYYAKKYNIPYILQAHGSVLPSFQKQRLKTIFDLFFGYRILKDATKVIALTRIEAEQYKKMGVDENKIEIVPNGIDLLKYENLPESGEFRRKYSIRDDEKMIVYLGRLHKSKGIDLLVKTFADVSKELNNVRLVLVGPDDGYLLALEELIKTLKVDNKVVFTGFVSNEEKMTAFVDADVFVTPSFSGFPVTFLEACACGTPIITTNKGDELDWIQDRVGYVVEYDKEQLRAAITKVLCDEGLRKRFGQEGKKLVQEEFSWDKIIKKVEGIYADCLS